MSLDSSKPSILRPGYLVAFSVRVSDTGLSYKRDDLVSTVDAKDVGENAQVTKWETTKILADAAEHAKAVKVQGKISGLVRKSLAVTPFGYFCTEANFQDLVTAIDGAKKIAADHNASSVYTTARVFFRVGKVATTDEQAARDIAEELVSIVDRMNLAITRLDPEAIREAVKDALAFGAMLAPVESEKVGLAVEAARDAANKIAKAVRRVEARQEEGEKNATLDAASLLASLQRDALETARIAFLDFAEPTVIPGEALAPVDVQRIDALDMSDDETTDRVVASQGAPPTATLEIESPESSGPTSFNGTGIVAFAETLMAGPDGV